MATGFPFPSGLQKQTDFDLIVCKDKGVSQARKKDASFHKLSNKTLKALRAVFHCPEL